MISVFDTHPPYIHVLISYVKEIMFWNRYLGEGVTKGTVHSKISWLLLIYNTTQNFIQLILSCKIQIIYHFVA